MTIDPERQEDRFAAAILTATPSHVPGLTAVAARHFADLVGVSLAALDEPAVRALGGLRADADGAVPAARVWGTRRRLRPRDAGLVNAFAGHWHDFDDDETELAMAHVTVTAMTAAAVLGDADPHHSGQAVLDAYLVGTETAMRLGRLLNPNHYLRGWHATATLGIFAAAAAAGRTARLDPRRMRAALGIAASAAAGLRSTFGSAAKPLQVARAVEAGLFAVECAAAGLDAGTGNLFGPQGFVALAGGRLDDVARTVADFGRPWGFIAGGMTLKAHPCCTASHSAIACVLDLMRTHDVDPATIDRITCRVDPAVPSILTHERPTTPAEAKFSLPFALAIAAVRRRVGIAEFTDEALADPVVVALIDRVETVLDPDLPKGPSGISVAARVRLELTDGRSVVASRDHVPGSRGAPLDDAALADKFADCAAALHGEAQARTLFARLIGCPDEPSFSTLISALVPARGGETPHTSLTHEVST